MENDGSPVQFCVNEQKKWWNRPSGVGGGRKPTKIQTTRGFVTYSLVSPRRCEIVSSNAPDLRDGLTGGGERCTWRAFPSKCSKQHPRYMYERLSPLVAWTKTKKLFPHQPIPLRDIVRGGSILNHVLSITQEFSPSNK